MKLKWNARDIIEFLEIYKQLPILWNVKHKDYCNRKLKEEYFRNLLSQLWDEGLLAGGVDEKQLKARIKSIKDVYRQELVKIERSKRSGMGPDAVYTPKLMWFEAASFLTECVSTRSSKFDYSFEDQQIKAEETDDPSVDSCNSKADEGSSKKDTKKRNREFPYNSSHQLKTIKKFRTLDASDRGSSGASPRSAHRNGADADDKPYDHFGKYVAAELRGLPQRRAYILQQELQALITHAKLSTLESEDSEGSPDSPTNETLGSNEELLGQFVINTFLPKTKSP